MVFVVQVNWRGLGIQWGYSSYLLPAGASGSFTPTFPSIPYPLATICKSFHFWTPITYLSSSWSRSWSFLRRLDLRFSVLLSLLSQLVSALLIFISAKNPKVSPFLALLLLLYVYWLVKGLEVSYFVDGFFFWYLFLYFYHLACWPWNYWEVRIFVVSSMMLVTQCLFYFMRYHIDIVMSFRRYSCFTLCGIISISLCLYAGILFFFSFLLTLVFYHYILHQLTTLFLHFLLCEVKYNSCYQCCDCLRKGWLMEKVLSNLKYISNFVIVL